jgi:hypothetical protein
VPAQLLGDLGLPHREHPRHIASAAPPAAGAKESLAPQHGQRLAEGEGRDAEVLGHDRFRRKPLARVEQPHSDGALELEGHLPAGPTVPACEENKGVPPTWEPTLNGTPLLLPVCAG